MQPEYGVAHTNSRPGKYFSAWKIQNFAFLLLIVPCFIVLSLGTFLIWIYIEDWLRYALVVKLKFEGKLNI